MPSELQGQAQQVDRPGGGGAQGVDSARGGQAREEGQQCGVGVRGGPSHI